MGTNQRPGDQGESTPTGAHFLDSHPGRTPETHPPRPGTSPTAARVTPRAVAATDRYFYQRCAELDDERVAELIASDPQADDPFLEHVLWLGPAREATPAELAALFPDSAQQGTHEDASADPGQRAVAAETTHPDAGNRATHRDVPAATAHAEADRRHALAVITGSVPHHPLAPRPNPGEPGDWSPAACANALLTLDPDGLSDDALLDYVHASNRLAAFAQGMESRAVAAFAGRRPPLPSEPARTRNPKVSLWAAGELMSLYVISQGAAEYRIHEAEVLAALPATGKLWRQGLLDSTRIRAIQAGLLNVPPALFATLEPLFLPGASRTSPAALTRKIRRLAEKHSTEALAQRHERATAERRLWFTPLPDGMAQLSAILPAAPALALFQSLQDWAGRAQRDGAASTALTPTGKPSRSMNNYLADCFLDLIHQAFLHPGPPCPTTGRAWLRHDLAGHPTGAAATAGEHPTRPEPAVTPRIPAKVSVEIPFLTLLGTAEQPGQLLGYGPIPADQARELAAGAPSWRRILTHPETGTVLSVGRDSYKPPADMVRLVRLRDPVCTGIGCDRPAQDCDIDHTVPFYENRYGPHGELLPKGETSVDNLRPRSRYCHRLKDEPTTGWRVEPAGAGTTRTITPTGRQYLHRDAEHDIPAPF